MTFPFDALRREPDLEGPGLVATDAADRSRSLTTQYNKSGNSQELPDFQSRYYEQLFSNVAHQQGETEISLHRQRNVHDMSVARSQVCLMAVQVFHAVQHK